MSAVAELFRHGAHTLGCLDHYIQRRSIQFSTTKPGPGPDTSADEVSAEQGEAFSEKKKEQQRKKQERRRQRREAAALEGADVARDNAEAAAATTAMTNSHHRGTGRACAEDTCLSDEPVIQTRHAEHPSDTGGRYPHISKQHDAAKATHNSWILESALRHSSGVLILDGIDLNTTRTLLRGGVDMRRVHVPNRLDFDSIVRQSHPKHGNLYRCTVQGWASSYTSLPLPRAELKTIWLDYTGRWSAHVQSTLEVLVDKTVMGAGAPADIFLTLNRDVRCPDAPGLEEVLQLLETLVIQSGATASFPRAQEYGSAMFIIHARIIWGGESNTNEQVDAYTAPDDLMFNSMRFGTRMFRKAANSRIASR